MHSSMHKARLVIFAKAPIPGYAKTRLIPALGEQGSARLAKRLLEHATAHAVEADLGPVTLYAAPYPMSQWPDICLPQALEFAPQGQGDLGDRLSAACESIFDDHWDGVPVIITGTDCPGLTSELLGQISNVLKDNDAVLVPASDGGYVAIGLSRFNPQVFSGIDWSTEHVCRQTVERFESLGWQYTLLPQMHDIDEQQDLQWLPQSWSLKDFEQFN
ncbi:TIGR04282 family arsenosugar biosynthesis glycosyltransferase [Sessilibacter corallicola]